MDKGASAYFWTCKNIPTASSLLRARNAVRRLELITVSMTAVKSYHKLLGHSHTAVTAAHNAESRRRGRAKRKHPSKTALRRVH